MICFCVTQRSSLSFAEEDNSKNPDDQQITQQKVNKNFFKDLHGYIDLNGYYDFRKFDIFTNNTLIDFPGRFQYFSFTNIFGPFGTADDFRFSRYYTEQNIRWNPTNKLPLDLATQWVSGSTYKDVLRFGSRLRLQDIPSTKKFFRKMNLIYNITFFPIQYDRSKGYDAQIEHFYRLQVLPGLLGDRVYISGFADLNFLYGSDNPRNHNPWVTETQLGVRIINQVYVVAEYRFNQFLPKGKKNGLGVGLEYLIKF